MIRKTDTARITLLCLLLFTCGCQTAHQARYSCGETTDCGDPVILFVGASRDVAKMGRVPQLADDFRSAGYSSIYFDPWRSLQDVDKVTDIIRQQRRRGRRVMVVGWSIGTVVGLKALKQLHREGIGVDTFVEVDCFNLPLYMGGDDFHPCNAGRVVVIRSQLNQPVEGYNRPAVHRLKTPWHLSVPHHDQTVRILKAEANRIRRFGWAGQTAAITGSLARSRPVGPQLAVQ